MVVVGIWTTVVPATISEMMNKYVREQFNKEVKMNHIQRFVVEKDYEPPNEYKRKDEDDDEEDEPEEKIDQSSGEIKVPQKRKRKKVRNTGVYLRIVICVESDEFSTSQQIEDILEPFKTDMNAKYPQLYFPCTVEKRTTTRYGASTKEQHLEWIQKSGWPLIWRGNVKEKPITKSSKEQERMTKYTQEVVKLATSSPNQQPEIVALIVNPDTDKVIAKSHDERTAKHPLNHAIMSAISRVAENESHDYLCNGLHVYVSHQPCVMCQMALLHSRITMLVYTIPAPGPDQFIHDQPLLNWNYECWRYVAGSNPVIDDLIG